MSKLIRAKAKNLTGFSAKSIFKKYRETTLLQISGRQPLGCGLVRSLLPVRMSLQNKCCELETCLLRLDAISVANEFLRFSHLKTLILANLLEKGHAVSAETTDNAKMFSQLISKSERLAKINESRLQLLLI